MRYSFDPVKQAGKRKKHGLDLADAPKAIESGQTDMSKAATAKTSPDAEEEIPLRRADVKAGKLVLRKRSTSLRHPAPTSSG